MPVDRAAISSPGKATALQSKRKEVFYVRALICILLVMCLGCAFTSCRKDETPVPVKKLTTVAMDGSGGQDPPIPPKP
jgi:hypothetical protein